MWYVSCSLILASKEPSVCVFLIVSIPFHVDDTEQESSANLLIQPTPNSTVTGSLIHVFPPSVKFEYCYNLLILNDLLAWFKCGPYMDHELLWENIQLQNQSTMLVTLYSLYLLWNESFGLLSIFCSFCCRNHRKAKYSCFAYYHLLNYKVIWGFFCLR